MSWGHDEYLYRTLADNGTALPPQALHIIRYHSFFAHHTPDAYAHLAGEHDRQWIGVLRRFAPCDLYSKGQAKPDVAALRGYYGALLAEFGLDRPLRWRVMPRPDEFAALDLE
jgi:inositol oxygenase